MSSSFFAHDGVNNTNSNLSAVLNRGNVMEPNQHIDGSVNSNTKISATEVNTLILKATGIADDLVIDSNTIRAGGKRDDWNGEINIQRQNVQYIGSTATELELKAPELKIENLTVQASPWVLGYDDVTGKVSYKAGGGDGGESLAVTLGIGNDTAGLPINAQTGEMILQKAGTDVMKTSADPPPSPFPAGPAIDNVQFDRPIAIKNLTGSETAIFMQNPNGVFVIDCDATTGELSQVSVQKMTTQSTNVVDASASEALDWNNGSVKHEANNVASNTTVKSEMVAQAKTTTTVIIDNTNNVTNEINMNAGTKNIVARVADGPAGITSEMQLDANSGYSQLTTYAPSGNGYVQVFNHRVNMAGNNKVMASYQEAGTDTILECAGYGNNATIRLLADDNLSNAEISYNKTAGTTQINTNHMTFNNTGDFKANLPNLAGTHAVKYDNVTKQFSYDVGGSGGGETLDQTLTLGNTTTQAIDWTTEIDVKRQGVTVLSSASVGPSVAVDVLSDALRLNKSVSTIVQGTNTPTPGNKAYIQNYVDTTGQFTAMNLDGGLHIEGLNNSGVSGRVLVDTTNGYTSIRSYDQVLSKSSEMFVDQTNKEFRVDIDSNANEFKVSDTSISVKTITDTTGAPVAKVLGYDTTTGIISYQNSGGGDGGGETLDQTLTLGNVTAQAINWNPEIKIQQSGADIISTKNTILPALGFSNVLEQKKHAIYHNDTAPVEMMGNAYDPTSFCVKLYDTTTSELYQTNNNGNSRQESRYQTNGYTTKFDMNPKTNEIKLAVINESASPQEETYLYLNEATQNATLAVNNDLNHITLTANDINIKVLPDVSSTPFSKVLSYDSGTGNVAYQNATPADKGFAGLQGTTGVVIPAPTVVAGSSIVIVTYDNGASGSMIKQGFLNVGSIVNNTSFTVYSTNPADTNSISYIVIN